jgi:hypothetical protein
VSLVVGTVHLIACSRIEIINAILTAKGAEDAKEESSFNSLRSLRFLRLVLRVACYVSLKTQRATYDCLLFYFAASSTLSAL